MSSAISTSTELRKLKPLEFYTLVDILNPPYCWKTLMDIVPKEKNSTISKFNSEHIRIIEQAARDHGRNAAEIFLDEWSTMGRERPTLGTLLELLVKAELFRAADYVACDLLKQEKPKRPDTGPAAEVDTSDAAIEKILDEQMRLEDAISFAISAFSTSDSLTSESAIETKAINEKCSMNCCELQRDTENLPDTTSSSGKDSANITEDRSDLIKFSVLSCEATDKHMHHTLASVSNQFLPKVNIGKDIND